MFYRPAGLPAWCLPAWCLPASSIVQCSIGGREGRALAVLVRVGAVRILKIFSHQRKPNAYSHRIGQIGNLDTAFAAVV